MEAFRNFNSFERTKHPREERGNFSSTGLSGFRTSTSVNRNMKARRGHAHAVDPHLVSFDRGKDIRERLECRRQNLEYNIASRNRGVRLVEEINFRLQSIERRML